MNRNLLKQVWNERRSNAFLWMELFVVFVILWYIVDVVYVTLSIYNLPMGFDIENTYVLRFERMTSTLVYAAMKRAVVEHRGHEPKRQHEKRTALLSAIPGNNILKTLRYSAVLKTTAPAPLLPAAVQGALREIGLQWEKNA